MIWPVATCFICETLLTVQQYLMASVLQYFKSCNIYNNSYLMLIKSVIDLGRRRRKKNFLTQNSGQVWISSFCKTRVLEFSPKPLGCLGNESPSRTENTSDCLINGALTDHEIVYSARSKMLQNYFHLLIS